MENLCHLFFAVGPGPEQQSADSLLDLGLDFNAGPTGSENIQSEIAAASSLLDEQFKMLGLDNDVPVNKSQTTSFQVISYTFFYKKNFFYGKGSSKSQNHN